MTVARLTAPKLLMLCLLSVPVAAHAQQSPPPGVLTLPKKRPAGADAAATPAAPPQPAPVAPVTQVAPFASAPLPQAPAKPYVPAPNAPATPAPLHKLRKPTPIVQGSPDVHAQHPKAAPKTKAAPATKPAVATPAATGSAPASQPAVAEPTVAGPPAATETRGTVTNQPLPRWASLRADEVNLRVGPGMRFPIEWQYHRRDLPVQILREVEVWRLIVDEDGVKGWVHQATLVGRRSFVVKQYEATMRAAASEDAAPVARLKPGVVGHIRACDATAAWCEVQVGDYRGWLKREQFFGTDQGEAVGG